MQHSNHIADDVKHVLGDVQPEVERSDELLADVLPGVCDEVVIGAEEDLVTMSGQLPPAPPNLPLYAGLLHD